MRVYDLIEFINSLVPHKYFANKFPKETSDACGYVKLTGGFPTRQLGVKQPTFQVVLRGEDSEQGFLNVESKAMEIHKALTNLQEVTIGNSSITIIRSMNSEPLYIGEDEQNRSIYSINFEMVVRP
jgi:Bacteriophage minor capsid protein